MGTVYLAEDRILGRQVAVKEIAIAPDAGEDLLTEQRRRFEVELKAAGKLQHPNIATVFDGFEVDGAYCIAMELVPGKSLAQRLWTRLLLPPQEVAKLAAEIAAGLDHAHRHGVIHRDVKPGNILFSDDGTAKITDFGIAKLASEELTRTGVTLGTPTYMSPEQVKGKPLDGRSDQFSLAVILYLLLTGERPFSGDHEAAVFHQILHAQPERPSEIHPALPKAVDRVLLRGLEKDPAKRFADCSTLAAELAEALAGASTRPALHLGSRLVWVAVAVAVVAIGSLTVWKKPAAAPLPRPQPSPPTVAASAPQETVPSPTPTPSPTVAAPEEIAVEIASEGGSCRVAIDGRHAGFTPLTLSLVPGPHEIACEWPGGVRRRLGVEVTAQQRRFHFRR
jgi:serine/threonine-protein kinase